FAGMASTEVVLAAADGGWGANAEGVYLSVDGGQTWENESLRVGSGLPSGVAASEVLVDHGLGAGGLPPQIVLYAGIPGQGVYRAFFPYPSMGGPLPPLVWTQVNTGLDLSPAGTTIGNTTKIRLAVHDASDGVSVYAMLIAPTPILNVPGLPPIGDGNLRIQGIFRSTDYGASWAPMGIPVDGDGKLIDPEGQGTFQDALAADPYTDG